MGIGAIAGLLVGLVASRSGGRAPSPQPSQAQTPAEIDTAADEAARTAEDERRRAAARGQTIATSPLGIQGESPGSQVSRKRLLGQ